MYKKNLVSSKVQNISGKLLLRWSEPLVIAKIVNNNNVLFANPGTGVMFARLMLANTMHMLNDCGFFFCISEY